MPVASSVGLVPRGTPRFPLFDSIRALAALAVLVVHTAIFSDIPTSNWYWPFIAGLDIGVPIFFLLSGCLLYRPMLSSRVLGTPSTPLAFYALRRFLRIMPAYWLALTVLAIVPGLAGVFSSNWWVYYGLLQNYPVYTLDAGCVANPLLCGIAPTWTLAIEVVFYLVLPFFALAMRWLCSQIPRTNWLALELATLGTLSAVSVAIQGSGSFRGLHLWLFFSPLGRAWWFGLGMGLAAVSVWLQQRGSLARAASWVSDYSCVFWGTAILLYVLPAPFVIKGGPMLAFPLGIGRVQYLAAYLVTGVIGVLFLLPAMFWDGRDGLPKRLLANPVLAWLGRISYGIFLWHYPIIHGLGESGARTWWPGMTFPIMLTGTLAITLVCATLSFYLLERPLMRLKYQRDSASLGPFRR
jgi:peptidoglycan/LPS O-acetylase OafA/YrhL